MEDRQFIECIAAISDLLPRLPRSASGRTVAREQVKQLARQWPAFEVDVAVFSQPFEETIEYDVLVNHPAGGTLALSYATDDGRPWAARFSETWLPYYIVTVNGEPMVLQEALIHLRALGKEPRLEAEIADVLLIRQAVEREGLTLEKGELQPAVDLFRRRYGLNSAEDTFQWLKDRGLTQSDLEQFAAGAALRRKLRDWIVEGKTESWFDRNHDRLDLALVVRVKSPRLSLIEELVGTLGKGSGDLETLARERLLSDPSSRLEIQVSAVRREDLSEGTAGAVFAAAPREISGPHPCEVGPAEIKGYELFQMLRQIPAVLDNRTRVAVAEALFSEWLEAQRLLAAITWHCK